MMQKPEITKKMADIAFWMEIGWIALNVVLVFLFWSVPAGTESMKNTEIPLLLPALTAVGQCGMIPFALSCFKNHGKKEIYENQAVGGVVLPAGLYFIGIVFYWVINHVVTFIASRWYGAEVLGVFSMKMQYQQFLNILPVQTAALVLVCCASAIELYILKHKES